MSGPTENLLIATVYMYQKSPSPPHPMNEGDKKRRNLSYIEKIMVIFFYSDPNLEILLVLVTLIGGYKDCSPKYKGVAVSKLISEICNSDNNSFHII